MLLIKNDNRSIPLSRAHIKQFNYGGLSCLKKNHVSGSKINSRAVLSRRIACSVATSCSSRHVGTCLFEVTDFILLSVRSVSLSYSFYLNTFLLFVTRFCCFGFDRFIEITQRLPEDARGPET